MIAEVPVPTPRPGMVLIKTAASLVSAGTERMLVEFAEKSLIGKAASRPDLVRQMMDKARREGILTTVEAAFNRLDQPMSLGYSSAGTVVAVGKGMEGFKPGDRLACAGGGFAVHAEYAVVPRNLIARLPENVDFESAAFTTLAAIALHGFRLGQPQVGERVAIIGLGLLGLLSAGIARAAGCQVFGVDINPARISLAEQYGARAVLRENAIEAGQAFSQGKGFDTVLICADTHSDDPVELAAALCRDRGNVIAVGAVGLNLPRKVYYEKEIQFRVSRSYGPGRYDAAYEEGGQDYPAGFVRWTEGRNLEAVVDLLASGKLDVRPLISHRFDLERAEEAYALITGKTKDPFLGVLLTYPGTNEAVKDGKRVENRELAGNVKPATAGLGLGVLGAGNYAMAVFLPVVKKLGGIPRIGVATASGLSAKHAMSRFGFEYASSVENDVLQDQRINTLAILTRHQHHARQTLAGLRLGKNVFCEKPLAIREDELVEIEEVLKVDLGGILMVGFNRRFAPYTREMLKFFEGRSEPLVMDYRVNAGFLPASHWIHDPLQGGGRIIGEGCHFIDFLSCLAGGAPTSVMTHGLADGGRYHEDNVLMTFRFADGSIGTVTYVANGDKSFPKEQVTVFSSGRVASLDDFRTLELVKDGRRQILRSALRQDKGHAGGWEAFIRAVKNQGTPPIPYQDLIGVSRAAIKAVESLRSGVEIQIGGE